MSKMLIKKGDTVIVKSGSSANGKEPVIGKVLEVAPKEGKVIVEGAHIVKKHVKARRQGENSQIVATEGPIYACKVMLYCPKCQKGVRVRRNVTAEGEKIRVCCHCGETL